MIVRDRDYTIKADGASEDTSPRLGASEPAREARYECRVVTVGEAVDRVCSGEWDVPEFQRQFVWQPSQTCNLADSLWRGYPIGTLLLWSASSHNAVTSGPRWWIADGQQRLTSLCLLFGREPPWIARKPAEYREWLARRFRIVMEVNCEPQPRFTALPAGPGRGCSLLVSELLALDTDLSHTRIEQHAQDLKRHGHCLDMDFAQICARLERAAGMRRRQIGTIDVYHEREDVLEIFARLNSRGMRFRRLLLKTAMEEIPAALRGLRGRCQP
jgi:Protein of unknown function DUF262